MSADSTLTAGYRIRFEPMNEDGEFRAGETILDCARRLRVRIASSCGGNGSCMSCSVQFTGGAIPEPTSADRQAYSDRRLDAGWRRACLTQPAGECTIYLPPRSTAAPVRTRIDGRDLPVEFDPAVVGHHFELTAPSIRDPHPDDLRLAGALTEKLGQRDFHFDRALLESLAPRIRSWKWRGRAFLRGDEIVAVGPEEGRGLGLAVDLGTTNVSATLVDLDDGETLAAGGVDNPQNRYGGDVISYASFIRRRPEGLRILQSLAIEAINGLVQDLSQTAGTAPADILEVTVAGNTMMHHLALGLPVLQLAMSPFVAAVGAAHEVKARELGIEIGPGAYVHFLPNIAGFVGGDHVAALLATVTESEAPVIVMDIGTNTEISLVAGGEITSVSCPSGPAFEGGHIRFGMRAAVGAIELIRIRGDDVTLGVIGDTPPVGICGSGVLDAAAQLYHAGVTDERGRLLEGHARVRREGKKNAFILADAKEGDGEAVLFTQDDVRAVQLAKASIRAATEVLLAETGFEDRDLDRVYIAGAFGNYLDVASALAIGLLPELPFHRFAQVGNAAGDGARQTLVSRKRRARAEAIARRCRYVELASAPSFVKSFRENINFPPPRRIEVKSQPQELRSNLK